MDSAKEYAWHPHFGLDLLMKPLRSRETNRINVSICNCQEIAAHLNRAKKNMTEKTGVINYLHGFFLLIWAVYMIVCINFLSFWTY